MHSYPTFFQCNRIADNGVRSPQGINHLNNEGISLRATFKSFSFLIYCRGTGFRNCSHVVCLPFILSNFLQAVLQCPHKECSLYGASLSCSSFPNSTTPQAEQVLFTLIFRLLPILFLTLVFGLIFRPRTDVYKPFLIYLYSS